MYTVQDTLFMDAATTVDVLVNEKQQVCYAYNDGETVRVFVDINRLWGWLCNDEQIETRIILLDEYNSDDFDFERVVRSLKEEQNV